MPLGYVAAAVTIAGGINSLVNSGGGSSPGGLTGQQSFEQQTIFGEQQSFEQQLAALIQNPSSVTSLPGYQFNLSQGLQSVGRQNVAGGFGGSGNEMASLFQYGEGYAMNTYNQQASLLAQLAGITAPSSPSQLGSNALSGSALNSAQLNNALYQLGILQNQGVFGSAGSPGTFTGGPYDNVQPGGGYMPPDSAPNAFSTFGGGGGAFGGGLT